VSPGVTILVILTVVATVISLYAEPRTDPPVVGDEWLPNLCMDAGMRERIQGHTFEALDTALKQHMEKLFATWMAQPRDKAQPGRVTAGTRLAFDAYARAYIAMEQWSPPKC
jgi:hypothetical protein